MTTTTTTTTTKNTNKNKPETSTKSSTSRRPCPFYKWVKDTTFTVDAFSYGAIEDCSAYFLTHFHSDHYQGLTKSFSHGPIYCTPVTANLLEERLKIPRKQIYPLSLNTAITIDGVNITLMDANHCPGAAIILFEVPDNHSPDGWRRHLHTGDFRAIQEHVEHDAIAKCPVLDTVYLDTTYLNPSYAFPAQSSVLNAVAELVGRLDEETVTTEQSKRNSFLMKWIKQETTEVKVTESTSTTSRVEKSPRVLFVVGTYLIGKERVFQAIANALSSKIYVTDEKRRILNCLEDPQLDALLTSEPSEAKVHVVSMFQLNKAWLTDYLDHHKKAGFTSLVAFRPTGWSHAPYKKGKSANSEPASLWPCSTYSIDALKPSWSDKSVSLYSVPYSEHSSFEELAAFIRSLSIRGKIQPTVNVKNEASRQKMSYWLDQWIKRE
ncbi:beta-lactamase-like protein [Syncephalis fuscata]|nr:beta-lactamase-like protein [Syncephalis fuscata]